MAAGTLKEMRADCEAGMPCTTVSLIVGTQLPEMRKITG
jgi:hypothetical protein